MTKDTNARRRTFMWMIIGTRLWFMSLALFYKIRALALLCCCEVPRC